MKRSLSRWLVVVLVLTCLGLTACGGETNESGTNPGNEDAAVESSGNNADTVSIGELLAKSQEVEGMSYDFNVQSTAGNISGKFWMQGDKFKFESEVEGQKVIAIFDGSNVYSYVPSDNSAIKISMDMVSNPETPLEHTEGVEEENAEVLETTVYDGVECRVVLVSSPDGQEEAKMWLREDYGIPVKVETTEADGTKTILEYKNLEIGPQPAETFELPSGVTITDMSNMM